MAEHYQWVSVRLTASERSTLEKIAAATDRTFSQVIRWLLRKAEAQPGGDIHLANEDGGHVENLR